MNYPEPFGQHYDRYLGYLETVQNKYFSDKQSEAVIAVSHGNAVECFYGLTHADAR